MIPDDELSQKYRHVFLLPSNPFGYDVLTNILAGCHFGCTLDPENKEQIWEYNQGILFMTKLGIFGPDRMRPVINALINSLISSAPKKEE